MRSWPDPDPQHWLDLGSSVGDLHHPDPDLDFHFDADPDPTFHFDADKAHIHVNPDPQHCQVGTVGLLFFIAIALSKVSRIIIYI